MKSVYSSPKSFVKRCKREQDAHTTIYFHDSCRIAIAISYSSGRYSIQNISPMIAILN